MPHEVVIPRLGWNMEEGTFIGWLKRDGETVKVGDPLFTLESDKAVQDIEAEDSGTLRIATGAPKDGETVPVGTLLAYLLKPGEPLPATTTPRSIAESTGIKVESMPVAVQSREIIQELSASAKKAITPRARQAARRLKVDPSGIEGTGKNGRVRERDILNRAASTDSQGTNLWTPLRQTIAERMVQSKNATAPVTLTTTVDATNLVNLRSQLKRPATTPDAVVPTYTDIIVKLTATALGQHPILNTSMRNNQIVISKEINIAFAVDTDAGLLVPVIHDVPGLTLRQLAGKSKTLAEKARQRQLTSTEKQGGTFTVTNLGAYGIDAFTPIINWPECAILGIGRIRKVPAVVGDQVVPRDQITLSLTFDHRLVDGAPAAKFLQTLSGAVENPAAWLVE